MVEPSRLARSRLRELALALGLALAGGVAAAGCGGSGGPARPVLDLPLYSPDGLRLLHSDADGDGRPDVIRYYREAADPETGRRTRTLVRTEIDLTGDGQINMRRVYDASGALAREDMDGNLDGRFDHVVYWENGLILRTETDTDHDGRFDEHRDYRDGLLSLVRKDTTGNGAIDTWSYYDRDGLARVGVDTTGDGEADRWTRRPE
jgi:hypothetical protein